MFLMMLLSDYVKRGAYMSKREKSNIIYIMAPKGYARRSIEKNGLRVYSPYHGDNGWLRIIREIFFRVPFLPKEMWYNKKVLENKAEFVNIIDINITEYYLSWIRENFPNAQINFIYDNMVGKARNISPNNIPKGIRIWTYDDYDARKFNIRLFNNYWVNEDMVAPRKDPEYDVFFIGRDKGRGEKLLALEKKMQKMGLKTKFIITKDGKLSKEKPYYQKEIPYDQIIDYDTRSRAILNVTMDNQEGVTMRDIESVAIGVKLITTNRNIVNKDLYHENNVFILGVDKLNDLPQFLEKESVDVWSRIKEKHTFEAMLNEITDM